MYYKWSKEFLEAGKARLTGDTKREATSSEVAGLRQENEQLKQVVAELLLKNPYINVHVLLAQSQTQGIISHAPSVFEERIDNTLVV